MPRLIAFAAALLIATAAQAGDQVFRWSSGELTSVEGLEALHQRAETHAAAFCKDFLYGTKGVARKARCVDEIVKEIVGSVNDRRLTSYVKTGRVDPELLARR